MNGTQRRTLISHEECIVHAAVCQKAPLGLTLTVIELHLSEGSWLVSQSVESIFMLFWVVIYSTLFSNILHTFRRNITYAQNQSECIFHVQWFNKYNYFVTWGCIIAMTIVLSRKKSAIFVEPTAETAVNEVSNSSVIWKAELHGHNVKSMKIYKPSGA